MGKYHTSFHAEYSQEIHTVSENNTDFKDARICIPVIILVQSWTISEVCILACASIRKREEKQLSDHTNNMQLNGFLLSWSRLQLIPLPTEYFDESSEIPQTK